MGVAGEISNPFNALVASANPISALGFNAGTAFVDFYGSMITSGRQLQISQSSQTLNDAAFWTQTVTGGATITDGGVYAFATGTNSAASAVLQSKQVAPTQTGTFGMMSLEGIIFAGNVAPPNNTLITVGALTAQNGTGFRWQNGQFKLVVRSAGIETVLIPAQFNGAPNFVYDYTFAPFLSILFIKAGCQFFSGSTLLHTYFGPIGTLFDFPLRCEAANTGVTAGVSFSIPGWSLQRLGQSLGQAAYVNLIAPSTTVIKTGAGRLQSVLVTTATANNGTLKLYDNTSASGPVIATINGTVVGTYLFDLHFSNGLTAVLAGNGTPSVTFTVF